MKSPRFFRQLTTLALLAWTTTHAADLTQTITYVSGTDWRPITFDPSATVPGSALDFTRFLDAPAGKYGRVTIQNGTFRFSGTNAPADPVRFYGINIGVEFSFLTHAKSELMAANLAQAGYNAIRLHSYDWQIVQSSPDSTALDLAAAGRFNQFKYFLHCLRDKGIYYELELGNSRYFTNARVPGMTDTGEAVPDGKFRLEAPALALVSDALIQDIATFAGHVLTTNGAGSDTDWTDVLIKDDPALISIEFLNEDAWWKSYAQNPSTSTPVIDAAYNATPGAITDPLDPARQPALSAWLSDRQDRLYQMFSGSLAALGVNVPLTDMSNRPTLTGNLNRQNFDYVDLHNYWAMPDSTTVPWNQDLRDIIQGRLQTPLESAAARILGKPFLCGEFNIFSPQPKRLFIAPVMAAYAGLQDWNGIFRCGYGGHEDTVLHEHATNRIEVAAEPGAMLAERLGSYLFCHSGLQAAPSVIPFVVTSEYLHTTPLQTQLTANSGGWRYNKYYWELGAYCRIGSVMFHPNDTPATPSMSGYSCVMVPSDTTASGTLARPQALTSQTIAIKSDANSRPLVVTGYPGLSSDPNHIVSETGQIYTDFNGTAVGGNSVKVLTPKSETFLIPVSGTSAQGNVVSITSISTPGICFLGSLDHGNLSQARRQLLLYLTDTQNSNSQITYISHSTFNSWSGTLTLNALGTLGHLAQQGTAQFSIFAPELQNETQNIAPRISVLSYTGTRQSSYSPTKSGANFTFPILAVTGSDAYFAYQLDWPFYQNYSGTTDYHAYFDPSQPSRGQFNDISAESLGGTWTVTQGRLQLVHPASAYNTANNAAGFALFSGSNPPQVAEYKFKLSVNDSANTYTNLGLIDVGPISTAASYKTKTPNSSIASQMIISGSGVASDNKTKLYCLKVNGVSSPTFSGSEVTVAWMLNHSGTTVTYNGFDSTTHTLAPGTSDVWLNGALAIVNVVHSSTFTAPTLGGLRFQTPASGINPAVQTTFTFDDVAVVDSLP